MSHFHFKKLYKKNWLILLSLVLFNCSEDPVSPGKEATNPIDMPYSVTIDPSNFLSSNITGNTFFPFHAGTTSVFTGENEEGKQIRVEEKVLSQARAVMGVTCVVVEFKEWEDGALIEIAYDWYGQDIHGNVWYFGEDVEDYKDGKLAGTGGSWEAGIDGALPGIIMFADPVPGLWYRQEYYKGEAEDVGQILSLGETVITPYGTFTNCLKTADWTPLEPGIVEHKYYAPGVGTVKVVKAEGETGFEELVDLSF